jgi:hypothetical protein
MDNFTSMHNDHLDPDRYINPEYCECCGERDMACTCMECVKCGAIGDPDCSERCGTPNERIEPSSIADGRFQYVADGKPLTDPLCAPAFSFGTEEYGVYVDYCIINGTIHTHGVVDAEAFCEDLFYDIDKLRDLNAENIRTLVENACWRAVEVCVEQGIGVTNANPTDEIERLASDVVEEYKHHMSHYTREEA